MNIEQARFNMIEQQIRPWDVLDPAVLSLLAVVQARRLRAAGLPRARLRRHRGAAARGPVHARAARSRRGCCRNWPCTSTSACSRSAPARATWPRCWRTGAACGDAGDPARAGAHGGRQPAPRRVVNVDVRTGDGARGLPGRRAVRRHRPVGLGGRVAARRCWSSSRSAGACCGIVGQQPVMRAMLVTRSGEHGFDHAELFDTVAPRLEGFDEPTRFSF